MKVKLVFEDEATGNDGVYDNLSKEDALGQLEGALSHAQRLYKGGSVLITVTFQSGSEVGSTQ
jgi:hypothetical protein